MRRCSVWLLLLATAAVAACSGGGSGSAGLSALPPAQTSKTGGTPHKHRVIARFSVKVPPAAHARQGRHGHYVSPATATIGIQVGTAQAQFFGVSATSPGCHDAGGGYVACTFDVPVTGPGTVTFNFTAYDARRGAGVRRHGAVLTGNILSQYLGLTFTVPAGVTSVNVPVTLQGVAASLHVFAPGIPQVAGSELSGFSVFGKKPVTFSIVAEDADGNMILGPGAPGISATLNNAEGTFVQSSSAPNLFTFTSSYAPTDPSIPLAASIDAQATPDPHVTSSVQPVTAHADLAQYTPWIYVADYSGHVYVYDEQGKAQTLHGAFGSLQAPAGIGYDQHDNAVFVSDDTGPKSLRVYTTRGKFIKPGTYGGPPPVGYAKGMAYSPGDSLMYVASPAAGSLLLFDASLNSYKTPSGAFSIDTPMSLAYDPFDERFFVASQFGTGLVQAFDGAGNAVGSPIASVDQPSGIAFDTNNDNVYVANQGNGNIGVYDYNLQTVGIPFPAFSSPSSILYDPFDGLIYIGDSNMHTIKAFDENGNPQTLSGAFANLDAPVAMTVVP